MIPDERLAETIERKNIPISASIELTWRCNLKCLFCYQYKPGDNELSTKEIKNIMDQLKEEGCLYLALTGGEPMTHPDFWEISEHARKNSFAVTLQTNGTLITPDIAKKIKELNFFSVHISLLGATAETHDTLSGKKGSFEKVINAAKSLKTSGVNVVFKTTVVKQNFGELGRIIDMADELGVQKTFSPVVYARSDGDLTPLRFRLDDDELREFYREMFRRTPGAMEPYRNGEFGPVCQFGRTDCCINSEGKIYPCVAVPVPVGDLKKDTFHNIWTKSSELAKMRSIRLEDLPDCSGCRMAPICVRCSGLALLEEGSILSASRECCRITKIIGEVVGYEKEKIQKTGGEESEDK